MCSSGHKRTSNGYSKTIYYSFYFINSILYGKYIKHEEQTLLINFYGWIKEDDDKCGTPIEHHPASTACACNSSVMPFTENNMNMRPCEVLQLPLSCLLSRITKRTSGIPFFRGIQQNQLVYIFIHIWHKFNNKAYCGKWEKLITSTAEWGKKVFM